MFTLIITIVLTILFMMSMIKGIITSIKEREGVNSFIKLNHVEHEKTSEGVEIFTMEAGDLKVFGGGVCTGTDVVAIESGTSRGVLEHELRHARRSHTKILEALNIFGMLMTALTPMACYFFGPVMIILPVIGSLLDVYGRFKIEVDADKIDAAFRPDLINHLRKASDAHNNDQTLHSFLKWQNKLIVDARIKRLA